MCCWILLNIRPSGVSDPGTVRRKGNLVIHTYLPDFMHHQSYYLSDNVRAVGSAMLHDHEGMSMWRGSVSGDRLSAVWIEILQSKSAVRLRRAVLLAACDCTRGPAYCCLWTSTRRNLQQVNKLSKLYGRYTKYSVTTRSLVQCDGIIASYQPGTTSIEGKKILSKEKKNQDERNKKWSRNFSQKRL